MITAPQATKKCKIRHLVLEKKIENMVHNSQSLFFFLYTSTSFKDVLAIPHELKDTLVKFKN